MNSREPIDPSEAQAQAGVPVKASKEMVYARVDEMEAAINELISKHPFAPNWKLPLEHQRGLGDTPLTYLERRAAIRVAVRFDDTEDYLARVNDIDGRRPEVIVEPVTPKSRDAE